jgi:hypothetical protein
MNLNYCFAAPPGFEPRQRVPKTLVLPLHYRAINFFIQGLTCLEPPIGFEPMTCCLQDSCSGRAELRRRIPDTKLQCQNLFSFLNHSYRQV